jgi:hypothetical protein
MDKKYILGAIVILVIGVVVFAAHKKSSPSAPPPTLVLQVPFTPQAPNDNWDRNEDCEETSITMANAFLSGTTENEVPADEAQKAINNLKIWEQANLGYNADTGAGATTRLAEGAFGLKVEQIKDFTEQDLKKALVAGRPILLPINAKMLNNPNYRNSGPLYHMIVLRGYNEKGFIINDPGTNEGNGNVYSFAILQSAAADWNQATKSMEPNNKIALVLSK